MILVLGGLLDSGIGHLVHRLCDRNVPFLLLDPRCFGREYRLAWQWRGGVFDAWLTQHGTRRPLTDVRAAYVHHLWLPRPDDDDRNLAQRAQWLLQAFLETAPFLVCNRPSCSATNFSKTWQQQVVAAHGFCVPRTLVTSDADEARVFYERCRRRVIFKSLSSRRSIVRRMTESDLDRLHLLPAGPVQFQEWVPGVDIRVHVMGSRLYATEITTEAVDYRYSGRDSLSRTMRGVTLPEEIGERCARLAGALGLIAAGVDLRRAPDGRWYCFEANPTPGFAFYEQYTGQRIADGLIDALLLNPPLPLAEARVEAARVSEQFPAAAHARIKKHQIQDRHLTGST